MAAYLAHVRQTVGMPGKADCLATAQPDDIFGWHLQVLSTEPHQQAIRKALTGFGAQVTYTNDNATGMPLVIGELGNMSIVQLLRLLRAILPMTMRQLPELLYHIQEPPEEETPEPLLALHVDTFHRHVIVRQNLPAGQEDAARWPYAIWEEFAQILGDANATGADVQEISFNNAETAITLTEHGLAHLDMYVQIIADLFPFPAA